MKKIDSINGSDILGMGIDKTDLQIMTFTLLTVPLYCQ